MATMRDGRPDASVVVVGIDFSEPSEGALRIATSLAVPGREVEIHLVHVVASYESSDDAAAEPSITAEDGTSAPLSSAEGVRTQLANLGLRVGPGVARMYVHVRAGKADVEIAQIASDLRADLIMIGAHGHRGMERILGSMADSLVRNAPCPVLAFYSSQTPLWEQIQPPCPNCVAVQQDTHRKQLWCARHSQHHKAAHCYHLLSEGYGMGWQSFR